MLKLTIDEQSSIPKYIQIIRSIKYQINSNKLKKGDKIPSINKLSEDYLISRDTVEKAYGLLRNQGIIESVKGKGYYISIESVLPYFKVLLLFNKLSSYKKEIYNSIVKGLENRAEISFHVYHCEHSLFNKYLETNKTDYDFYLIMPHFKKDCSDLCWDLIQAIPKNKLILIDNLDDKVEDCFGAVYQDFKNDIYSALVILSKEIASYNKMILVFPERSSYPYPDQIKTGFIKYAKEVGFDFEMISEINENTSVSKGDVFVVIEEADLVNLIKICRKDPSIRIGENLGILSYNETPLKEILEKGITVISTDFSKMGSGVAQMILNREGKKIKNDFHVIKRNSL